MAEGDASEGLLSSPPPAESAWKEAPHWLCIGRETC